MTKYNVDLIRTITFSATVEVEAENPQFADSKAQELAEADINSGHPTIKWEEYEDVVEANDVNETEDDEDTEEEK